MTAIDFETFNYAVGLAELGKARSAYRLLKSLELSNQNNHDLLLWLISTTSDVKEAEQLVSKLEIIDPNNHDLIRAKQWLSSPKFRTKHPIFWPRTKSNWARKMVLLSIANVFLYIIGIIAFYGLIILIMTR